MEILRHGEKIVVKSHMVSCIRVTARNQSMNLLGNNIILPNNWNMSSRSSMQLSIAHPHKGNKAEKGRLFACDHEQVLRAPALIYRVRTNVMHGPMCVVGWLDTEPPFKFAKYMSRRNPEFSVVELIFPECLEINCLNILKVSKSFLTSLSCSNKSWLMLPNGLVVK